MNLNGLNQLMGEVYIILGWGLGNSQAGATPNRRLAERVYYTPWVDTGTDGSRYDVRATIQRLAPQLSAAEGVELVLECHKALQASVKTIQNMREVPPGLRKYVG